MTTPAKRLVACKGWRWMPGMLIHAIVEGDPCMYRLDGADEGLYKKSWILVHESRIYDDTSDVTILGPDLNDPGTMGCLLALVREAWGLPGAYYRGGWVYNDNGGSPEDDDEISGENGMSEAEALVAALEAAP